MKLARLYKQYIWIVSKLQQHGRLTLAEMDRMWMDEEVAQGNPLSRTTFNRHRDAILDMFGLVIDCDRLNRYYIANPNSVGDDSIERWMLSTLTVSDVLTDSMSLKDRIMLEEVPSGLEYLHTIIRALKGKRKIRLGYQKFGTEGYERTVSPYALKLFHQRWYLLALNDEDAMRVYALDRMTMAQLTEEHFEMPQDFSPQDYFAEYFGVLTDGTPMEHVVIRAYGRTADYLRTLPLHHSQREMEGGEDYVDFSFDIRPTADFLGQLLSHANGVEVLEPESVRQKMKEKILAILKRH